MKEVPIIFSSEMVMAILAGKKSQTRRPVKPQGNLIVDGDGQPFTQRYDEEEGISWRRDVIPPSFAEVGGRLWVRETFSFMCHNADPYCWCDEYAEIEKKFLEHEAHYVEYKADTNNKRPGDWPDPNEDEFQEAPAWRPSIHMPRWASRITLDITAASCEKVQNISEEDAVAEGVQPLGDEKAAPDHDGSYRASFAYLWDSIYGNGEFAWENNPWVWVIKFKRVE